MKNILITGGARGLGKRLIDVYYTNGYNVFTVVRKQEDAQKLSKEFDDREFSYSYRIAKASQNMLSICLKQEFKTCNINIISIHPGRIQTQSGSSDANSSALEAAKKIYKWIEDGNINKDGTFTEPYERDWNW